MKMRFAVFIAVLLFAVPAKADYYVWKDEKTGLSVTFPDTWTVQANANPDTIMTVSGGEPTDQATCILNVTPDARYTIYPPRYGDAIQRVAVSRPFWEAYLGRYGAFTIDKVQDGAGLGRWFASFALASYERKLGTVMQARQGIMFASLYNDKLYTVECSALSGRYDAWADQFKSIIKSVDFKKAYHEVPTGEYENFLSQAEMYFWAPQGPDGTSAY